jgi:hypothetical protein
MTIMNWIESAAEKAYIHPVFPVHAACSRFFRQIFPRSTPFRYAVPPVSWLWLSDASGIA